MKTSEDCGHLGGVEPLVGTDANNAGEVGALQPTHGSVMELDHLPGVVDQVAAFKAGSDGAARWLRAAAGRFWGAGGETPTSQALEAVDVPSVHR